MTGPVCLIRPLRRSDPKKQACSLPLASGTFSFFPAIHPPILCYHVIAEIIHGHLPDHRLCHGMQAVSRVREA